VGEIKYTRDVFIEELYNRMHTNEDIFFLCADFGSPKLDTLRERFSDRFINVGIAEQNLVNVATGLALEGYTVYAYAIAPFLTMRAYEQIRVNLALQSQVKEINVNLIGVGAGLSYDISGATHHCLEDISIMRTLPNMVVFSPSDWVIAQKFVDYSLTVKKPKYLRFDGKPLPRIYNYDKNIGFDDGFGEIYRGDDVCIVTTGFMMHTSLAVVERLAEEGIPIGLIDVFMLKPLNEELFYETIKDYACVVTIEESFIGKGGLDGLVSKILDDKDSGIRLKRLGFNDTYVFDVGNRAYLHGLSHLDANSIADSMRRWCKDVTH